MNARQPHGVVLEAIAILERMRVTNSSGTVSKEGKRKKREEEGGRVEDGRSNPHIGETEKAAPWPDWREWEGSMAEREEERRRGGTQKKKKTKTFGAELSD